MRSDKKKPLAAEATEAGYCQEMWSTYQERSTYNILMRMQKKSPWRTHQSVGAKNKARGKRCWGKCPGLKETNKKRTRSYDTIMICKECSAKTGGRRETMCCHATSTTTRGITTKSKD